MGPLLPGDRLRPALVEDYDPHAVRARHPAVRVHHGGPFSHLCVDVARALQTQGHELTRSVGAMSSEDLCVASLQCGPLTSRAAASSRSSPSGRVRYPSPHPSWTIAQSAVSLPPASSVHAAAVRPYAAREVAPASTGPVLPCHATGPSEDQLPPSLATTHRLARDESPRSARTGARCRSAHAGLSSRSLRRNACGRAQSVSVLDPNRSTGFVNRARRLLFRARATRRYRSLNQLPHQTSVACESRGPPVSQRRPGGLIRGLLAGNVQADPRGAV